MPSGVFMPEQVLKFKTQLWVAWCLLPTKKSNYKYKVYPMPDHFVPFHVWNLWCTTGPPLGEACHVIWISEMMLPRASFPANGTDIKAIPQALSELMKGPQNSFVGRNAQRTMAKQEAADMMSPRPEDKRALDTRIRHLQMLLKSKFLAPADKEIYEQELFEALKASVCTTKSFLSPRQSDSTNTFDSRPETPVSIGDVPGGKLFEPCQFRNDYLDSIKQRQENLGEKFGLCLAAVPDVLAAPSTTSGPAITTFAHISPMPTSSLNVPPRVAPPSVSMPLLPHPMC